MEIKEYADDLEEANDPAVGDGTPETAPDWTPEDEFAATEGLADDGDDESLEDGDDGSPIGDEI